MMLHAIFVAKKFTKQTTVQKRKVTVVMEKMEIVEISKARSLEEIFIPVIKQDTRNLPVGKMKLMIT